MQYSFPDALVCRGFNQRYNQILMYRKLPVKERKLLLGGPPDSGKRSYFASFHDGYYIYFN